MKRRVAIRRVSVGHFDMWVVAYTDRKKGQRHWAAQFDARFFTRATAEDWVAERSDRFELIQENVTT